MLTFALPGCSITIPLSLLALPRACRGLDVQDADIVVALCKAHRRMVSDTSQ